MGAFELFGDIFTGNCAGFLIACSPARLASFSAPESRHTFDWQVGQLPPQAHRLEDFIWSEFVACTAGREL